MAKESLDARPIARSQTVLNTSAASEGVGDGDVARRARRGYDAGASEGPPQQTRKRRRRERRERRRGRREEVIVRDRERTPKTQEVLKSGDGTERHVAAGERQKASDQDGRAQMTRTIRLAKARREKAHRLGVDNHKSRSRAKRSNLGRASRRRHGEQKRQFALMSDKIERARR